MRDAEAESIRVILRKGGQDQRRYLVIKRASQEIHKNNQVNIEKSIHSKARTCA